MVRQAAVVLALLSVVTTAGCGRHAAPAPKAKPPAVARTPLPEWAPKHPSPEFLRAWKLLKPMTQEELQEQAGNELTALALQERDQLLWPAAYQFFGALSDSQIRQLTAGKQVLIPVTSLTARQRHAFDTFVGAYHKARSGRGDDDYLVDLYKHGARRDLSNVRVGFVAGGHTVQVCSEIGRTRAMYWFADL